MNLILDTLLLSNFFIATLSQIECEFKSLSDGYNCKMQSTLIERSVRLQQRFRNHEQGKENSNVEVLWIQQSSSTTRFLPIESCTVFTSLKKISVHSTKLEEISRNVFRDCGTVKRLIVSNGRVSNLQENIFFDLLQLKFLTMENNKIEYLPMNLFLKNSELKEINFEDNLISSINANMPRDLRYLTVKGNICADKTCAARDPDFTSCLNEIMRSCLDSIIKDDVDALKNLSADINTLKLNVSQLDAENSALLNDKDQCESNLTSAWIINSEMTKSIRELESGLLTLQTSNQDINATFHTVLSNISTLEAQKSLVEYERKVSGLIAIITTILVIILLITLITTIISIRIKSSSQMHEDVNTESFEQKEIKIVT